jgi:hypothetical protein
MYCTAQFVEGMGSQQLMLATTRIESCLLARIKSFRKAVGKQPFLCVFETVIVCLGPSSGGGVTAVFGLEDFLVGGGRMEKARPGLSLPLPDTVRPLHI